MVQPRTGVSGLSRKQQLLKRHRRNKRMALLAVLIILVVTGVLIAWWLPLLLAVLVWVGHEAWFADHLFYSPAADYDYQFEPDERFALTLKGGRLLAPAGYMPGEGDTLVLAVRLKATLAGRFVDPGVHILCDTPDRQDFERGSHGLRYLNLTGQPLDRELHLRGRCCTLADDVELLVFRHPDFTRQRTLVIAPHADDAELAAFALYSAAPQSWIVTLTAGEIEADHYQAMGLSAVEASRLKGRLRAWDSLSVPLWANVPREQCVQLGYFCLQLPAMQQAPDTPIASREADLSDTRPFRAFNAFKLASDADGAPTWSNLLQDLVELVERIQPDTIVLPHPRFDPHPDHICAQDAVMQALQRTQWQPRQLLQYANHLHDNDRWPMGNAGSGVALPPRFEEVGALRPWALPVSLSTQVDKAMALGMMHDLQPPMPFKRVLRRVLQRFLAGRRWPVSGENEFFRKAVRRHELFWVSAVPAKRDHL